MSGSGTRPVKNEENEKHFTSDNNSTVNSKLDDIIIQLKIMNIHLSQGSGMTVLEEDTED